LGALPGPGLLDPDPGPNPISHPNPNPNPNPNANLTWACEAAGINPALQHELRRRCAHLLKLLGAGDPALERLMAPTPAPSLTWGWEPNPSPNPNPNRKRKRGSWDLESADEDDRHQALGLLMLLILAGCGVVALLDRLMFSEDESKPVLRGGACWCRICQGEIKIGRMLGEGGGGRVFTCTLQRKLRVVKMIKIDLGEDINALGDALEEAKHLIELRHKSIVSFFDFFFHRAKGGGAGGGGKGDDGSGSDDDDDGISRGGGDYVCIVMEYCDGGSLLDHIATGIPLHLDVVVSAFHQVMEALAHVHRQRMIHFDVKLENIFLTSHGNERRRRRRRNRRKQWHLKVGDFGLAVHNRTAALPPNPKRSRHHRGGKHTHPKKKEPNPKTLQLPGPPKRRRPHPNAPKPSANANPKPNPNAEHKAHPNPPHSAGVGATAAVADAKTSPNPAPKASPGATPNPNPNPNPSANPSDNPSNPSAASSAAGTPPKAQRKKPKAYLKSAVVGGTAPYQAPECFDGTKSDDLTPKVDSWALGCALFEAVTCTSLPMEEPYVGQLALDEDEWPAVHKQLTDRFHANLRDMLATAAAEKLSVAPQIRKARQDERLRAAFGLEELFHGLLQPKPEDRPDLREAKSRVWWSPFKARPIHLPALSAPSANNADTAGGGPSPNPVKPLSTARARLASANPPDASAENASLVDAASADPAPIPNAADAGTNTDTDADKAGPMPPISPAFLNGPRAKSTVVSPFLDLGLDDWEWDLRPMSNPNVALNFNPNPTDQNSVAQAMHAADDGINPFEVFAAENSTSEADSVDSDA